MKGENKSKKGQDHKQLALALPPQMGHGLMGSEEDGKKVWEKNDEENRERRSQPAILCSNRSSFGPDLVVYIDSQLLERVGHLVE